MPVKRRGDSFQVDVGHKGARVRKSFTNEADALAWESEAVRRIAAGLSLEDIPTRGKDTLETLMAECQSRYWKGTRNEDNAVRNSDEVVGLLGKDRDPRTVTARDLDKLIRDLEERGNSAGTINRKLATISKLFKFGIARGVMDRAPTIERKRESTGRVRWYTKEEEARIIASAEGDIRDFLAFLLDTGARLSEALRVRRGDVDDLYVRLQSTKNDRPRAVPLTARVREMVKRRLDGGGDTLFPPEWTKSVVHKLWAGANGKPGVRQRADITGPDALLHTFRHTCASRLVQAGTPIQVVQQWLGHTTLTMTLRYAHLAPHNILGAVQALENAALPAVKDRQKDVKTA